jgi:hypothetical protein
MDTSTVISLTGTSLKAVGEVVADLKRQDLAGVSVDLLNLKRSELHEKLKDFYSDLAAAATREKGFARQDLVSRGFVNSSLLDSTLRGIEQDASTELDRATREYNRAIEEIALLERKAKEEARPWWKRLLRCLAISRG